MKDTTSKIVDVHYLTDIKFISLSNKMEFVSVPNVLFKTMLNMSNSVDDNGIIQDKKKFDSFLNVLETQKQRPPKTDRTNINYSDELNECLRNIKLLTYDKTTGKKKVFKCGNIINTNVRNPEKLKEYQETQKKKKTSK